MSVTHDFKFEALAGRPISPIRMSRPKPPFRRSTTSTSIEINLSSNQAEGDFPLIKERLCRNFLKFRKDYYIIIGISLGKASSGRGRW